MRPGHRHGSRRKAVARFLLALAGAAAAATAARAQDIPTVISPLRVETDHNNVNLVTGRTTFDLPVLSVPGAPNLRFDRVQNAAPYVKGTIEGSPGEYSTASYSVHSGAAASESFHCVDIQDCSSVTGTGSTFRPAGTTSFRYRQAGSGALYIFDKMHTNSLGPPRRIQHYASRVEYPNGEIISYFYQTAIGGAFNQTFYRPSAITSNLGYYIGLTYATDDFNSMYWNSVSEATLYSNAAPATPLGRLTYGATITDLGGREFTCLDCHGIEVTAGSLQLPGEGSPAVQVTKLPSAQLVQSVVRDAVPWTYSYSYNDGAPHFHSPTNAYWYTRLTVTGPNGFNQVYNFTISGQRNVLTGVTDSIGRPTIYQFDPAYRPIRIVSPEGNEVSVAHDLAGNIVLRRTTARPGTPVMLPSVIDERAFYPIADLPNLCTVLCWRPTWSRDGLNRQTDYAYNDRGQLTEQTDPADANGVRRKTIIEYATSVAGVSRRSVVRICGDITTCGTNAEIRTEYEYGGPVLLPSAERRIDASSGANVTLTTQYGYDAAGRLLSVDGPLPGTDDATHNRYDVHGRRIWEIGGRAPGGVRIATRTTYRDSDDRPVSTETGTLPDENSTDLTVHRRTDLSYDARRNPVREALSAAGTAHGVTERSFDDRGQLQCTAVRMNPAAFASPADACTPGTPGGDGPDRITRNVYDAAGQRLQLREGVGSDVEAAEATWAYSPNGQVTQVIDGNGNRATLRYDGHGRQDRWTFPSATRPSAFNDATPATALATAGAVNPADYEEYGYDAAGNRTSLRKRDGSLLTYTYDALNRMIVKAVPERPTGPQALTAAQTRDVHYSYDLRNLQLSARFDSQTGEGVTNSYDGFGRLTRSIFDIGGIPRQLDYAYDAAGNRSSITYPDGIAFGLAHDALGRPTNLFGAAYIGYGDNGLPNGISRANGIMTWLGYDGASRLSSLRHFATAPGDVYWAYGYNPAGQIAGIGRENDAYAWTGHYGVDRTYATNGLNQYSAAGGTAFAYDANGNLTSDGSRSYVYDVENRLVSSSTGAALVYDPLGRLFQVSTPTAGVTRFLYDGDALVVEYNGGNFMARRHLHWPGADRPALTFEGAGLTQPFWLHADHQGSIVALSDGNGAATINRYDEYGIPGATNTGRFQYTGQAWLAELGMYYYKARIYSPTLGRFMQTDPVGYTGGMNLYGYVGNDPLNLTDPDGQCADRYEDRSCKVNVDRRTGAAGIRAGRELEGVLNRYDRQINALDSNSQIPVLDRGGNTIGNLSSGEIKAVWNGTHFSITSRNYNNGGAGGGMRGAWSGNRFEGWARFTPAAVNAYASAAEARGLSRAAGVSTMVFHEVSHETHLGNRLQNRFPVRSTPDPRRERPTSSIGEAMARSVGGEFNCDIAAGCQ